MKIGEFLNKIATKGGISATDKHLIDVLAKPELATIEIDDAVANQIDAALMTVEAAKSHPEVLKKIKTETLNGADSVIDRTLTELGYSDEEIADIKADKNTYSRIEKTAKLIKSLEAKKAGANAPDKAAFQKQIDELNGKLRTTAEQHDKVVNELKSQHEAEVIDLELSNLVSSKKLSLPEEMDPTLKHQIAVNAVKADLKAKGFQIVKNKETRSLEVKRLDGTDAYDEKNNKVDLKQLTDGALAQNKLLAVTVPDPPAPPAPPVPGKGAPVVNQAAIDMIDAQIAAASQ